MAQTIKLKRSATAGNAPTTSQLSLGEIAINTTDGKLFIKRSVSGTESIVEVGSTASFLPLSGGTLTGSIDVTGSTSVTGSASANTSSMTMGFTAPNGEIKVKNTTGAPASNLDFFTTNSSGTTALAMRLTPDRDVSISRNLTMNGTLIGASSIACGSVTSTGLTVDGGTASPIINLSRSGTYSGITFSQTISNTTGAGADLITYSSNNDTGFSWQTTDSGGSQATALLIAPNRDISFYNSAGSSQNLFWDSSASSLGIGVTNPSASYAITANRGFKS